MWHQILLFHTTQPLGIQQSDVPALGGLIDIDPFSETFFVQNTKGLH